MDKEKLNAEIIIEMLEKAYCKVGDEYLFGGNKYPDSLKEEWLFDNLYTPLDKFANDITLLLYGLTYYEIECSDKFEDWDDIEIRADLKEEEVSYYYFSFTDKIDDRCPECFYNEVWFEALCESFDEINNYIYKYGTSEERKMEDECFREVFYDWSIGKKRCFFGLEGEEARQAEIIANLRD